MLTGPRLVRGLDKRQNYHVMLLFLPLPYLCAYIVRIDG